MSVNLLVIGAVTVAVMLIVVRWAKAKLTNPARQRVLAREQPRKNRNRWRR